MRGFFVENFKLCAIENSLPSSADREKWLADIKVSKKVNLKARADPILHLFGRRSGVLLILTVMHYGEEVVSAAEQHAVLVCFMQLNSSNRLKRGLIEVLSPSL